MLTVLRRRYTDEDEGFTLIELMVVVLIIAILIAIAIPTFLGQRERAQETAAKSNIRNAYAAAKSVYTDSQDWSTLDSAAVAAAEPTLTIDNAGAFFTTSDEPKKIAAAVSTTAGEDWVVFAVESQAGNKCFLLAEVVNGGATFTAPGTFFAQHENASCEATASGQTWGDRWGA